MMGTVRQEGRLAIKTYPGCAMLGAQIARRSEYLCLAGISTPPAAFDPQTSELYSPWIDGPTGRGLFLSLPAITHSDRLDQHGTLLLRAVEPLGELHELPPGGLDLMPLNIFAKIDPRLAGCQRLSKRLRDAGLACRDEIAHNWRPPQKPSVVHGDYHLGQLVFERQTMRAWLLDLDDMALGPAEFDIANFAAHFVTSRRFYTGDVLSGFNVLVGLLRDGGGPGSAGLSDRLLDLCGAAALLRRSLKLAERHESESRLLTWLDAARQLAA